MHRQLAVCRFSKSEHRRLDGWLVQWTVYLDVCKLLNTFHVAKINCGNGALHRRAQVCGRATRGTVCLCGTARSSAELGKRTRSSVVVGTTTTGARCCLVVWEHEHGSSSRQTTAPAVSSLNRVVSREKPDIDGSLTRVVHALSYRAN